MVVGETGKGRDLFQNTSTSSTMTLVEVKLVSNVDLHQGSGLMTKERKISKHEVSMDK